MPFYRNICLWVAALLFSASHVVIASEDNPWRMEESGERQQPYDNLNVEGAGGPFNQGQGMSGRAEPSPRQWGNRQNESIVPKSSVPKGSKTWQSGPGKGHRDEVYGYAGPQPKIRQRNYETMDRSRFGAFPPVKGMDGGRQSNGAPQQKRDGVQIGGRSYGAFPPLESRQRNRERQQRQKALRENLRRLRLQSSEFANVPPPPIPDPVPERARPYPYSGYGSVPGYGTGFATGLGMGTRYGPSLVDPGMLGLTAPGFGW